MKYLLLILIIISCSKEKKTASVEVKIAKKNRIECDFLAEFYKDPVLKTKIFSCMNEEKTIFIVHEIDEDQKLLGQVGSFEHKEVNTGADELPEILTSLPFANQTSIELTVKEIKCNENYSECKFGPNRCIIEEKDKVKLRMNSYNESMVMNYKNADHFLKQILLGKKELMKNVEKFLETNPKNIGDHETVQDLHISVKEIKESNCI